MGATTTLVTVREFLELPELEGERMELIGGEVVTMGYGKAPHEIVKSNLLLILAVWLAQNPVGQLFAETMFQLDDYNSLMPDLSVVFPGHVAPGTTDWLHGAPEIAIEVVSSETAARLEEKVDLYLAHGGKSVWAAFPRTRSVRIFAASGLSKKFEQNQTLEDPIALPGFSTPVSAIFEGI
jgi:Uma2 family endonuclease